MAYYLNNSYTDDRYFGLLQSVTDPGSQKYDAVLNEVLPAGDADLDGTVNYADFQILEANYGLSDTWWEQGDFNDDGVVNWSDLNLLRTNLDPAAVTLSQFAQIALFGQPSVITAGQAPEYDGYGVTYVSDMPWISPSNGQGPVERNQTAAGLPVWLGGSVYPHALAVYADSNVAVNLGGQYTTFQSEIGVLGSNNSSSVIFQIYGDGKLPYQSPVTTSASGTIPVNLNVAGVQQLSLNVVGSTNNTGGDFAAWADPRLISTANFSQYQVSPYTMTWQVSENGQVLSTQTTDSFVFPYVQAGVYTISLTVTDANGDTVSASTAVTVNSPAASATLINEDTNSQGNWIGVYGSQDRDVVGNASSSTAYATVIPAGEATTTWAGSTTDSRALEDLGGTGRVAAAWSSTSSFTVNVSLTDGTAHDIALYTIDWDNQGRSERIQITNAATGAVLDTETVSNFSGGVYLDWRVSGDVVITVTRLTGPSAVVSGLFLDAPPTTAIPVTRDTTTQGSWIGTYGTQGYNIIGLPAIYPSYATATVSGQLDGVWDDSAIDPRALQVPDQTNGFAGNWSTTTFSVHVNLSDGQPHDLALYAVDWADKGRRELI
jgi:NPCBM/NEW2 domain